MVTVHIVNRSYYEETVVHPHIPQAGLNVIEGSSATADTHMAFVKKSGQCQYESIVEGQLAQCIS